MDEGKQEFAKKQQSKCDIDSIITGNNNGGI